MMRSIVLGVAVVAIAGTSAFADDDAARKREAEKAFRAGEQAYEAGQYDVAAEAFEQAYDTLPLSAIAFSAAQAYRLQYFIDKDPRRLKRAIELYRKYLAAVKQGARRDDAATNLAELEPILDRIETSRTGPIAAMPAQARTRIMVSSNVAAAMASVDGSESEKVPFVRPVAPGKHTVKIEADGYFEVEQEYAVVDGQLRVVEMKLEPRPASVRLETLAGAQVMVDGRLVGTTPLSRPLALDAGTHLITVLHRGRHAWSKELSVARGAQVELSAPLRRTTQRKVAYGVLGTSAVFVIAGSLAGLAALGADSEADELETKRLSQGLTPLELERRDDRIRNRDDAATATYVLYGVGASLAIAGTLLYVIDMPRQAERERERPASSPASDPYRGIGPVTVAPMVSPSIAGVALEGRFCRDCPPDMPLGRTETNPLTIEFEKFWFWLQVHTNCILRAGTPEVLLFDHDDFHWHLAAEDEHVLVVQLMRAKEIVAEMVVLSNEISYVQAEAGEGGEVMFECVVETEAAREVAYHFVLAHGFEDVESGEGGWTH